MSALAPTAAQQRTPFGVRLVPTRDILSNELLDDLVGAGE
jgi:hypothetical protein